MFTSEGVELGEEDIEFIKNSATIYVSRGIWKYLQYLNNKVKILMQILHLMSMK